MRSTVHRFTLSDPGDVSPLAAAIDRGDLDPATIVAVIGKTPGNGLVNDYTRGYLTQSLALLIAERTGQTRHAVVERVPFIFSGGTEGVLTPHYTVLCVDDQGTPDGTPTLAIATAFTAPIPAADIGRRAQVLATAEAVRDAMRRARIESAADVHFVQVKGPCLTAAQIAEAKAAGVALASDNPDKSMAYSRVASAFGVALALGELSPEQIEETAFFRDFERYSGVASCSSGVEVQANEIVVLGNSRHWAGDYRIAHREMRDALDIGAIHAVLEDLGLRAAPQLDPPQQAQLAALFVKCEADRTGLIRGQPHTMLNDGDMNPQRHIRGALGAIVAAVTADTRAFVSGGAEHQGPDGGGLIAAIARKPRR